MNRQPDETKKRYVVSGKAPANNLRGAGVLDGRRTETVKSKYRLGFRVGNGQERLSCAFVRTLACVKPLELLQWGIIAVKPIAIMLAGDRLCVPDRNTHDRFGSARAAFRSFALGAGGFSRSSSTRRLFRSSQTCARPARRPDSNPGHPRNGPELDKRLATGQSDARRELHSSQPCLPLHHHLLLLALVRESHAVWRELQRILRNAQLLENTGRIRRVG